MFYILYSNIIYVIYRNRTGIIIIYRYTATAAWIFSPENSLSAAYDWTVIGRSVLRWKFSPVSRHSPMENRPHRIRQHGRHCAHITCPFNIDWSIEVGVGSYRRKKLLSKSVRAVYHHLDLWGFLCRDDIYYYFISGEFWSSRNGIPRSIIYSGTFDVWWGAFFVGYSPSIILVHDY